MNWIIAFVVLTLLAPVAWAQSNDLATERARLANQRIEAEARAREVQERQASLASEGEQANAAPRQRAPQAAIEPRNIVSETPTPSDEIAPVGTVRREAVQPSEDVDWVLEQIRTLGQLRDAGYVTDTEFDLIKQRILDGTP